TNGLAPYRRRSRRSRSNPSRLRLSGQAKPQAAFRETPMSAPAELTAADCPLLRDAPALKAADLIDAFNQFVRQIGSLSNGSFAYLLNRQDIQGIIEDVQRVRGQLTRPRYRVGFLGTSQAGKSTTFNNVLQEVLAQSGIGEAT